MMNKYKVSVLIPCYNSERYIAQTLDSCLGQTCKDIEIIVVDDGSTDNSIKIIEAYASKYPNIRLFTQKNKGAPAARNKAFEHAQGKYIQYLDADDILGIEKLASQISRLAGEDDSAVVYGPCRMFEDRIEESMLYDAQIKQKYDDPQKFLLDLWSSATMVLPHSWLVHRSLVERAGGWDETLLKNQDGAFFAKVVSLAGKVLYDAKSMVYYRTHNQESVSRKRSYRSEASRLTSYKVYESIVEDRLEEEEVRKALAVTYSYFIFANYPLYPDLIKKAQQKIESLGFKEPINVNISLYKKLAPLFGIYGAIRIHKLLSSIKQALRKMTGRKA